MFFYHLSTTCELLSLALALSAQTIAAEERDSNSEASFYVAPNGNDAWSGRLPEPNEAGDDGPFATLNRARQAVRKLKQVRAAEGKEGPIKVQVRGGEYLMSKPVVFTPEDSGTAACPITYEAYPGETPVFSGGKCITGFKPGEGELWVAEIPEVKAGKWYFRQLYVNRERRRRARLPQEGYYKVAGSGDMDNKWGFQFNPGEIDKKWRNIEDVEIVVLQFWTEARLRIDSIDEAMNKVRFTGPAFRPLTWSGGWWVENVFEGLAQPGDWYLDRQTGLLYYLPLPREVRTGGSFKEARLKSGIHNRYTGRGEDMAKVEVVAPVTKHWLRLEGDVASGRLIEHLIFRGLDFRYSSWSLDERLGYSYPQGAVEQTPGEPLWPGFAYPGTGLSIPQSQIEVPAGIYAEGAHHIRFEENEISHTGAWGIDLALGCQDNEIVGNHIFDLGAGAIRVGGTNLTFKDAEESCRTQITDNHIHDGCNVYMGSPAVWIGQSGYNLIAHNEIHGGFEWAISVGWQWGYMPPSRARNNIVEYNHLHHLGVSVLGTHAVVYFLGISPGTVVRCNLIEYCSNSHGICLDNSASGILVENNLVHHVEHAGLVFNFNTIGNIIQNNIFAFNGQRQVNRYGDLPWEGGKVDQTGILYRNIIYWKDAELFRREKWDNFDIILDYNLYYDASGKPVKFLSYRFEEWKEKGLDQHSIIADPLFVDPENGDFTLKPESPAFKLGFKAFDLTAVGPRSHSR